MKELNCQIARRDFLKCALGASALALTPITVLAKGFRLAGGNYTLVYWNGAEFVSADRVSPLTTAGRVRFRMSGFNKGSLLVIDHQVRAEGKVVPFFAWMAPPRGLPSTQFYALVDSKTGVDFVVKQGPKGAVVSDLNFGISGTGPKLAEGVFVLFDGSPDISTVAYDGTRKKAPVAHSNETAFAGQYVVIEVAAAGTNKR